MGTINFSAIGKLQDLAAECLIFVAIAALSAEEWC